MTIMEEREQKNNNYWSNKVALSEAFFSIIDAIYSRSNEIWTSRKHPSEGHPSASCFRKERTAGSLN